MSVADDWQLLGIAATDDRREIKRAYGHVLKGIDVDADPAAFIRLREALDNALEWGVEVPWWEDNDDDATTPLTGDGREQEDAAEPTDWVVQEQWEEPYDFGRMPPPIIEGSLGTAMLQLDLLLFEEGADPAKVARLGCEILGARELEHIDTASATEQWLADTIIASIPASDPLLAPAIKHFGWDCKQSATQSYAVQSVFDRAADREKLAAMGDPSHAHHRALRELRGPARTRVGPFQQQLVKDVSDLLSFIETWHPTIEKDLEGPHLDWWQNYISSRLLPPHFWKLLLVGSLLFTTIAVALLPPGTSDALGIVALLGSIALSYTLLRAAVVLQRTAHRLHEQDAPLGVYVHLPLLSAAIFGSPLLFAAVGPGRVHAVASVLLSATLAITAYLRCAPPQWEDEVSRWDRRSFPIGAAIVSACILVEVPWAIALQLTAPLVLCCWFGSRGWHSWALYLGDTPERQRLTLYGVSIGLMIGGTTAAILGLFADPRPVLLVSVPLAVLSQHLVLASTPIYLAWLEWPLRSAATFFFICLPAFRAHAGEGLGRLTLSAMLYLLAFSFVKIGAILLRRIRLTGV
ncbi:hypothetical protein [Sphingomonas qomolangmaensis]|uniref:J domain-containing protein n=1 Tax=Sphingomonas qomolangmaensis TaxID=2918765 RepID=A0ABY5LEB1_9SPHN|nr:hypothetical protein [Sphingomonas qomolangmaensis]UUL84033.1 hypothetical protein NMP03_07550 [Sphingomonas qomolangmaensis]